ncbi:MAG: UPF0182 family protein [Chloroflexi bacterium]|nr:UPF0182 family protein [Chloroflexota bacterium]
MFSWWKSAAVVVFVLFSLFVVGVGIYADWIWFASLGLEQVFQTRLIASIALFAAGFAVFLALFLVNILVASRLATRQETLWEFIAGIESRRREQTFLVSMIAAGVIGALVMASSTSRRWDTVLPFFNGTTFGAVDPLFKQDISMYVFVLPFYNYVLDWLVVAAILIAGGTAMVYGVKLLLPQLPAQTAPAERREPIRLNLTINRPIRIHLSILVAVLALLLAARHWLDIYGLVSSRNRAIFGADFTDANVRLPGQWILVGLAALAAILVLANIWRRDYKLATTGVAIWFAGLIIFSTILPTMVQRFVVQPSELEKETPYIESHIKMTREAYALDRIDEVQHQIQDVPTAQEVENSPSTIRNIRLWDTSPLLDTYNQIQSIRGYYDFVDVDIDRYVVDGEYRQVMTSVRELSPEKLPAQAQTWVNRRLQFTHGYGVAMSPVNEVTPEGLPTLFIQDVPPRGKIPVERPEVYYGEKNPGYVIVNTQTREFDYPKGDENVYSQYQAKTGVGIGSFLSRLVFAWNFHDVNLILPGPITADSKILYNLNIKERAQKVAPFLTFDRDPYVVVADGKLYWIQDAYTSTDRYPYSQPYSPGMGLNYLRNSVKVVTDAYDGSVRFFLVDPGDPLVQTYARIFPSLFTPMSQMPESLRQHIRYPEDLFRIQAEMYRTYHMKDPRVFYNKEDSWSIPNEIYLDRPVAIQPYYVIMRLPGESKEEFVQILPYTPPNKNNMITWLAARSDGQEYGKLVAYKYPKDKLIYGPMQIEARIDQDPRISEQLTLWNQSGSRVIRGNLLVIPIGQSNLYVEPIYLQSEQGKLPELKRVVLAVGNKVVMEPTVAAGLSGIFGAQTGQKAPVEEKPSAEAPEIPPGLQDLVKSLQQQYDKTQQEMKSLQDDIKRLSDVLNQQR